MKNTLKDVKELKDKKDVENIKKINERYKKDIRMIFKGTKSS